MGRKIPGLIYKSKFKDRSCIKVWRITENKYKPGYYGFLMAELLYNQGKLIFPEEKLMEWKNDLIWGILRIPAKLSPYT